MSSLNLDLMRKSGSILAETLDHLTKEFIRPGISAFDVSNRAEEVIRSHKGAKPAFLGYHGFEGSACVSLNEEAVHGVPRRDVFIKEGDIVSVDCGVNLEGHYTDACRTIAVGVVNKRTLNLLETTKEALDKGIEQAIIGNKIGDISFNIQKHVERKRFKVHLDFVGHGIGEALHMPPCVPNYGPPGKGDSLVKNMCLAIEPVVFDGSTDVIILNDGWTIKSPKSVLSAHFEDTIIITEKGPEIITRSP